MDQLHKITDYIGPKELMGYHYGDFVRVKCPHIKYAGWLKVIRHTPLTADTPDGGRVPFGYWIKAEEKNGTKRYFHSRHVVAHSWRRPGREEALRAWAEQQKQPKRAAGGRR